MEEMEWLKLLINNKIGNKKKPWVTKAFNVFRF